MLIRNFTYWLCCQDLAEVKLLVLGTLPGWTGKGKKADETASRHDNLNMALRVIRRMRK
jgi:hypothetical protein